MTSKADLRTALKSEGVTSVSDDVLEKCMALGEERLLSPTDLATGWTMFLCQKLNNGVTGATSMPTLNMQSIGEFTDWMMKQRTSSITQHATVSLPRKPTSKVIEKEDVIMGNDDSRNDRDSQLGTDISSTPSQTGERSSIGPTPSSIFKSRTDLDTTVAFYKPASLRGSVESDGHEYTPSSHPRCTIDCNTFALTNVQAPYPHFSATLEQRSNHLNENLDYMRSQIIQYHNLDQSSEDMPQVEDVGVSRQGSVYNVGRICNEAHEGRLNSTSVLIEDSQSSIRVPVDFKSLQDQKVPYSLFPGQVVALSGTNSSSRNLVAQSIYAGAPPKQMQSSVKQIRYYNYDSKTQNGSPCTILVASGPFTTVDELDYQPLIDLLSLHNADVVILIGPFVDATQEIVQQAETPPDEIFRDKIASLLEGKYDDGSEGCCTQFVLVPSLDDANSDWLFPQPPLDMVNESVIDLGLKQVENVGRMVDDTASLENETLHHRRVHCVPNPCTFCVNEVVIGVCSVDTLWDLSAHETNANLAPGTRLKRLAEHLLDQQSYYPLCPASKNVNVDISQWKKWQMPCAPDILILPSQLAAMACPIGNSNTLLINPRHSLMGGGTTGGTYASVTVYPYSSVDLDKYENEEVEILHNIHERTVVEIKKI